MATPSLAPRRSAGTVGAVWIVAALAGIAIGIFATPEWRAPWLTVALGGSLVLAFLLQILSGTSHRFIERVALSVLGALVVLGIESIGFAVAALFPV
ncbi:hypothetical protein ABCS02_21305 [Microbacterium sp. X-17]|uniref:hypothetical protein n=1 Tax=Microbacterium sp. X-17 TaxID=3144404 RepID=UPI0031F5402D